jgi:hypothetical protein
MSRGWRITVVVLAVAGVVSTPLVWLLDGPGAGQFVGASVQAAAGVGALAWVLLQSPEGATGPEDEAVRTGTAGASDGGRAVSGVKRPRGAGRGSARAERTGDATATGDGSSATSGVDNT